MKKTRPEDPASTMTKLEAFALAIFSARKINADQAVREARELIQAINDNELQARKKSTIRAAHNDDEIQEKSQCPSHQNSY